MPGGGGIAMRELLRLALRRAEVWIIIAKAHDPDPAGLRPWSGLDHANSEYGRGDTGSPPTRTRKPTPWTR